MATADTFAGGSVTYGSNTGLSLCILSGSKTGPTVNLITTTCASTTGGSQTGIANAFKELVTFEFEVIFDIAQDLDGETGTSQAMTVTLPLKSGESTAGKYTFTGHQSGVSNTFPLDDRMTASVTIQAEGKLTYTAPT